MDYLSKYAKKGVTKHQAGGPVAAPAGPEGGAPAGGGGGADIQGMLMQFAETQDPQLAVAICNELLAMMQGGGQGAPAPAMEKGGRMTHNAPMFKKGGKLA